MTNDNSANNPVPNFYRASAADFKKIPGSPIAYWVSDKVNCIFSECDVLENILEMRKGLATSDNDRFLREWHEVELNNTNFSCKSREETVNSKEKWYPINKGGPFKKWYGNNEIVINWKNDGYEIRNFYDNNGKLRSRPQNIVYSFKPALTWSKITSGRFSARFCFGSYLFDDAGAIGYTDNETVMKEILPILTSKIGNHFLDIINCTLNFQIGDVSRVPYYRTKLISNNHINLVNSCIDISREEWDSRETSWDFTTNELLHHKTTNSIEDAYNNYCTYWKDQFFKLHANEEELNRIFIDIYDLADELTPDVPLKDITILKTESEIKDSELVFKKETLVKQFISYAVGCMFGRYSPDKEGLILANQGETINDFKEKVPEPSFMPDDDNIIPILEDEYFKDDIVGRFKEFLKVTFGADSLAGNLEFIAWALSKSKSKKNKGPPEKVIRDYFLKDFFKDHVKMYKKRPIYWLFTSGKGRGFNALVYMHRYDKETLAKMRTDYLLELEAKLDARIGMLSKEGNENETDKLPLSERDKQEIGRLSKLIDELTDYDAVLNNKALQYIEIDLDDGVKVNYAKFEGLVEKI